MASAPTESKIFVKTLKKCEHQVIIAIRNNLNDVAWSLEDKGIIDHKLYKKVTKPKATEEPDDLAREVHEALKGKVEEDPSIYHVFLTYIRGISPVTATKLDEAFAIILGEQGGTTGAGQAVGTPNVPTGTTGGTADARQSNSTANVPAGATGGTADAGQADISPNVPTGTTEKKIVMDGPETPEKKIVIDGPETPEYNISLKSDHEFEQSSVNSGNFFGQKLESIHDEGIKGNGIKIAIIDKPYDSISGIQITHKALTKPPGEICAIEVEKVYSDFKFPDDHALVCTAIAVGEPFVNAKSIKYPGGVAPRAKATVFLVDSTAPKKIAVASVNAALDKVIAGDFHVLSLSFGGQFENKEMSERLNKLLGKTIVVAAAGNSGNNYDVNFPAIHPDVIAVGSMNYEFKVSGFSAENDKVDIYYNGELMAPCSDPKPDEGTSIANPDVAMKHTQGTSMATPGIAGLACLIMQCARKHGTDFEDLLRRKKFMLKALNKIIAKDSNGKSVPHLPVLIGAFQSKTKFQDLLD